MGDRGARRFARKELDALIDRWAEVDEAIEAASKRWRLNRMDHIDRNVLRLATVELMVKDTPKGVVLAEAVRLAARFGASARRPS